MDYGDHTLYKRTLPPLTRAQSTGSPDRELESRGHSTSPSSRGRRPVRLSRRAGPAPLDEEDITGLTTEGSTHLGARKLHLWGDSAGASSSMQQNNAFGRTRAVSQKTYRSPGPGKSDKYTDDYDDYAV